MSDTSQAVDALHDVRQQNFILPVSFLIPLVRFLIPSVRLLIALLHSSDDLQRLRQRLVALGQTVQTLVDVHLSI
jgi:hypothetical protein